MSTTTRVSGAFDVTMTPQPVHDAADGSGIGRMALDKRYHGALEAKGTGEMLAFRTTVAGSAGYVAIEKVDGVLDGRTGTFVLQHTASMARGAPTLSIRVVPDSGTGDLVGLNGELAIRIDAGRHCYDFDFAFTGEPA